MIKAKKYLALSLVASILLLNPFVVMADDFKAEETSLFLLFCSIIFENKIIIE